MGGGGGGEKVGMALQSGVGLSATGGNPVMIDPHTLILKMQPVMPTGSPMPLQVFSCPGTDTAGKGPACSLPCLSSGAFSCLSDTAEKGPAVSTATLQKS